MSTKKISELLITLPDLGVETGISCSVDPVYAKGIAHLRDVDSLPFVYTTIAAHQSELRFLQWGGLEQPHPGTLPH